MFFHIVLRQALSTKVSQHVAIIVRRWQSSRLGMKMKPRKAMTKLEDNNSQDIGHANIVLQPSSLLVFIPLFTTPANRPTADSEVQSTNSSHPTTGNSSQESEDETSVYLMKLLGLNKHESEMILKKHPELKNIPTQKLAQRISFLEDRNMTRERIAQLPHLLLCSSEELEEEVDEIASYIDLEFNCAVELLAIPGRKEWMTNVKLAWLADQDTIRRQGYSYHRNRINCLAEVLECEPWVVAAMTAKSPNIMYDCFEQVLVALELYFRHVGFSYEEIIFRSVLLQGHCNYPCLWYFLFVFIPNFYLKIFLYLCLYVLVYAVLGHWFD